jgi:hypothetical protein
MTNLEKLEKKVFELCNKLGETTFNNIHIIQTEYYNNPDDQYIKEFRLYHSGGHCLDISKQAFCNDETGRFIGYEYNVYQQWDGFTEMPLQDLISELNYQITIKNNSVGE